MFSLTSELSFVVNTGVRKLKTPANNICRGYLWRRRRDSNPRNPFGVYTISSRAPSTRLGDFSVFLTIRTKMLNDCIIFEFSCQHKQAPVACPVYCQPTVTVLYFIGFDLPP